SPGCWRRWRCPSTLIRRSAGRRGWSRSPARPSSPSAAPGCGCFTPRDTPHGLTFVAGGVAAVGDTLFAGSLGRAHRGPEYYDQLLASARLILSLPDETVLLPGHGPLTTVGQEKRGNPFVAP